MRNFSNKLLIGAALVAGGLVAAPAMAASGTGDATVSIRQAIAVTKTSDLAFGNVVASSSASTVAIAENNTRTCGSSLTCYGTATAGAFSVSGTSNETVTVAIDTPTVTMSDGASHTMSANVSTSTTSLVLSAGSGTFKVAGTLNVGASQAAGNYTGQFNVSVNYQ